MNRKTSLLEFGKLLLVLALSGKSAFAQGHFDLSSDQALQSVRTAYTAGKNAEAVLLADQAIAQLTLAEHGAGALAELHFWRGASLRRLDRTEEALVALDTSHRLGLRVPELHLERALARRALKQDEAAEQDYQEAERLLPLDDARRLTFAERWKSIPKGEPQFQLTVTPQLGYDSNIFGLEKDAPLVSEDLEEKSLYFGLVLGLKYYLHRSESQLLAVEYRNQFRAYEEDSELNYSDNIFSAFGRQPFLAWADLEVRAALGEAFSDGESHLRTTRTVAPALLFQLSSSVQARLWGDWTDVDYYIGDLPTEQDRDGRIARAGLVLGFDLGKGWSLAPHVGFGQYDADGDDYDHDSIVAGLAISTAMYLGCVFSPSASYTIADYDHPNSVEGFSEKREDRIWRVALAVTLRELEKAIGYAPTVSIAFLDHGSSLSAYDYRRWEPRVEITMVAISF